MEWIQLSIDDFMGTSISEGEQMLKAALRRGSGYENSEMRIYAASKMMSSEEFRRFLREEFGTGGHSMGEYGGFCDYDHRGITIRDWKNNTEYKFNWDKVQVQYRKMISMMEFPREEVRSIVDSVKLVREPRPRLHYEVER